VSFRTNDPEADFTRREQEQEEWLKSRPVCAHCKEHIQDERLMVLDGQFYHFKCADKLFGEDTEDFVL
jgi:hypothetical protein